MCRPLKEKYFQSQEGKDLRFAIYSPYYTIVRTLC